MSFPDYLDDMESQLASYLGEDLSTFSSNENPTVSAPVDSLEKSSYDKNGRFTWDDFLKEEGIETNSPPPSTWEWNATEADFYRDEIVAPPTVDETSPEEPAQSSKREEEARTNVKSGNTNEQPAATPSEPEPQPEENTTIPNDDSLFGEDNSDELVSPVSNTGDNSNGEAVAAENQPPNTSDLEQEGNINIPGNNSLFGGSTSDDVEVPNFDEEHRSEILTQGANSTPGLVADTPQNGDSAASAPITPGADLYNSIADNDNDSLFGDVDDSGLGDDFQPPKNTSPTGDNTPTEAPADDVDDLFGSKFGADFEAELAAELEAELKKDSANAVAPAVPKHTGLHLPKPPRKVAKSQGLYLPDPPRAITNPQGLHLPEPPRAAVNSQGLQLPDPPRVVANSQGLNLPSPPPVAVVQQSGVDSLAQEQTDDQEDEASTRRRRVRASKIPRSDMSRPKGRGQAGKVLTQLSGPAPSKLPETAASSSSGADDTAEKVTHLPRWAFGKYTSFGKPVAGSRYRKPNNSVKNPIPLEDGPESAEETNDVNPEQQNVAQTATEIPGVVDLTSDSQEDLVAESNDSIVQNTQSLDHTNSQVSAQIPEDFQAPFYGSDREFAQTAENFSVAPELSFPPMLDDAIPAPQLRVDRSHLSLAPNNAPNTAPPYQALQRPTMESNPMYSRSIAGGIPFVDSNNHYRVQAPDVPGTTRPGLFPNNVDQSPYTVDQTGAYPVGSAPQPMHNDFHANGNYGANKYDLYGTVAQEPSNTHGGSTSSGLDNSRPKNRPSHERAEYGDPRVLMTYGEFKQIFPQEQTRGCFETAIQNEQAADAAIIARGGVPPQRPTIRKSIICTWSQVQHLNRLRVISGEKLFEPKPNARKRPAAFKKSMQRKRQERGETSDSEETDGEPEPKRMRLTQEPMQMAPSPGRKYGEHTSQIRSVQPDNPQGSADASHLPPNYGALHDPVSQGRPGISFPQIHQPVPQSFKRKMNTEQWEGLEAAEQEMGPTAKRPKLALSSRQHPEPTNDHSIMDGFKKYVLERQSEYLKLRVPELRELCKTREVKHGNVNLLSKGGLVGVLVGQDVSRHPVYSQMHNQAHARQGHPASNVGGMGGINSPPVAVHRGQQQLGVPNGWGIRQDLSKPDIGPVHGMGMNYHGKSLSQFPPPAGYNAHGPIVMGNGSNAQSSRNFGRAQQPSMSGNVRGLTNNSVQPLANTRQPPGISQPGHGSMTNQSRGNLYARSQLPVSAYRNGYNNSGIRQNLNGSRNNLTSANAQIPAYGISAGFGNGIYQPAVDDRRRNPRILGQDAPSRVPQGNQRSFPQPAMNNTARQYTSTQQPMVGSASGNIQMGHQANTLGSQIPRLVHRGNIGGDPRRFMQNRPQGGLYSAPMQGLSQGVHQQHSAAQSSRPPYFGPP
ncbi:hypothetical protein BCON_0215g00060 [Botryotinia convoluta]|uniref:Uncharacterized protein n=1 Tax=Botryotinia convoluta TaxID=54673 RepID=A0A4Z1HJR9_9HELO|nr:hypothetical protein BCON_0215g00060 [Botryotinia convoluta]